MKLLSRRALIYHCKRLNSVKHVEASTSKELKPVIGLEIHAQLLTRSKMFSNAPIVNHAPSNTNVSLFDLATPGTLPTLNKRCVEVRVI
jgi:aspartyl-tRNA(Asn)/glutamyl-tRNA(Gln) amidotransferase subunit B